MKRKIVALAAVMLLSAVLAACDSGPAATPTTGVADTPTPGAGTTTGRKVVVSSKNFTEEFLLGEMYALMLEDAASLAFVAMDMADPGSRFIARLNSLPDSIKLSSAQQEQIRALVANYKTAIADDLRALGGFLGVFGFDHALPLAQAAGGRKKDNLGAPEAHREA